LDIEKHKKLTTYLTIFAIIFASVPTIFILIGFNSYSKNLEPNNAIDSVFGLGTTLFALISIMLGFVDVIYLINDGLFKKSNFLKFISLLIVAFTFTQIVLFSYQVAKWKRSQLNKDDINVKNNHI